MDLAPALENRSEPGFEQAYNCSCSFQIESLSSVQIDDSNAVDLSILILRTDEVSWLVEFWILTNQISTCYLSDFTGGAYLVQAKKNDRTSDIQSEFNCAFFTATTTIT